MSARIHAFQVCCPVCNAHPGEPCLSRQKNPRTHMHDQRADAAARKSAEQKEMA
jgi:hypothetical protein